VIDDPTEIFADLALPLSWSRTCVAASALAAPDTCLSQTARAPIVDPTEIFADLGLPLSCSGTCVAASALAASDTCLSQKPRAPMFGSSGRSVGAPIYGLPPTASLPNLRLSGHAMCHVSFGQRRAPPFGSSAKFLKYTVTLKSKAAALLF